MPFIELMRMRSGGSRPLPSTCEAPGTRASKGKAEIH